MSTKSDFLRPALQPFRVFTDDTEEFPWIHLCVADGDEIVMTYHHAERLADALRLAASTTKPRPHLDPHGIYRDPIVCWKGKS